MMSSIQNRGKEPDELISGDAKPKLDLFRTCIAAIPRLLPDPMSHVVSLDSEEKVSKTQYFRI